MIIRLHLRHVCNLCTTSVLSVRVPELQHPFVHRTRGAMVRIKRGYEKYLISCNTQFYQERLFSLQKKVLIPELSLIQIIKCVFTIGVKASRVSNDNHNYHHYKLLMFTDY